MSKKVGKHALPRKEKKFGLQEKIASSFLVVPLLLVTIPSAQALTTEKETPKVVVAEETIPEYTLQEALTITDGEEKDPQLVHTAGTVTAVKAPEPEPEPEPVEEEAPSTPSEEEPPSEETAVNEETPPVEASPESSERADKKESRSSERASTPSSDSSSDSVTDVRSRIIAEAKKHIGVRYQWGGTTPSGFDCSGYTSWVYKHAAGVSIPRTSGQQLNGGTRISKSEALPGDLIHMPGHVGIYAGNGQMYHAPSSGKTVSLAKIWTSNYTVVRYL